MRNKILVIMPTRSRPGQALEAAGSVLSTSTGLADVLLLMDRDDRTAFFLEGPHLRSTIGERQPMLRSFNDAALAHCRDYNVIGFTGDDVRYQTKGWDRLVYETLDAQPGVVYGYDGIQNAALPTHPFMSCMIPRQLGYAVPTEFRHYFYDNFVQALMGYLVKRNCGWHYRYNPELITKHQHHSVGGCAFDQTYRDAEALFEGDRQIYLRYCEGALARDGEILASIF